jgi:hypothetical protein
VNPALSLSERIISAVEGGRPLTPWQWAVRVAAALLLPGGFIVFAAYAFARLWQDLRHRGDPRPPPFRS